MKILGVTNLQLIGSLLFAGFCSFIWLIPCTGTFYAFLIFSSINILFFRYCNKKDAQREEQKRKKRTEAEIALEHQQMLFDGEEAILTADLALAETPKKFYSVYQKAIKEGHQSINFDEAWIRLINISFDEYSEKIQNAKSLDRKKALADKWKAEFDLYHRNFSLEAEKLMNERAQELYELASTNSLTTQPEEGTK